jgi:outer membrane lipoprotein-sorting protein
MRKILLAALVLAWSSVVGAADRSAKEILEDARRRYRVENAVQTMKMTLVSRSGKERVRELEIKVRRDGDILSSYTRFLAPSDVAGTQLVLVDHPGQDDDQLLYLPALERVTRISGKARSGSFMGSDFRYSDFELDTGAGSTHALLEENAEWWVVETSCGPGEPDARFVTHVSRADSLPRRVEWFDDTGALTRRMTVEQVDVKDGVPVPTLSRMEDLKRETSTRLEITTIDLGVTAEQVPDEVFTTAYMERNG